MTRCLKCSATATNVSIIPVVNDHTRKSNVADVYEMSTYGATFEYLKRRFSNVIASEYFPGALPGEVVEGIRNEDVQCLSFPDESLDLITANQVFEHVADDIKGFRECYRVLRIGGALIFTVPLTNGCSTIIAAEMVDGKLVHHQEPTYHDSRTGGVKSALVFRHYSFRDIVKRVNCGGFNACIVDVMIASIQQVPQKVIYAVKEE